MTLHNDGTVCSMAEPKSWKPEVIADASGKWCPNGLAFANKADAEAWVAVLADRRVVPSDEEPNR